MNVQQHYKNWEAFTADDLAEYAGKHVAWNLEGTAIVASGVGELEVYEEARTGGYTLDQLVFSYVPYENEVFLGAALGLTEDDRPGPAFRCHLPRR